MTEKTSPDQLTLVERVCACGCGMKFKVLATSTLKFATRGCAKKIERKGASAKDPGPEKADLHLSHDDQNEIRKLAKLFGA